MLLEGSTANVLLARLPEVVFFKNDKESKGTLAQFGWTQEERGINHKYFRINYRRFRDAG